MLAVHSTGKSDDPQTAEGSVFGAESSPPPPASSPPPPPPELSPPPPDPGVFAHRPHPTSALASRPQAEPQCCAFLRLTSAEVVVGSCAYDRSQHTLTVAKFKPRLRTRGSLNRPSVVSAMLLNEGIAAGLSCRLQKARMLLLRTLSLSTFDTPFFKLQCARCRCTQSICVLKHHSAAMFILASCHGKHSTSLCQASWRSAVMLAEHSTGNSDDPQTAEGSVFGAASSSPPPASSPPPPLPKLSPPPPDPGVFAHRPHPTSALASRPQAEPQCRAFLASDFGRAHCWVMRI